MSTSENHARQETASQWVEQLHDLITHSSPLAVRRLSLNPHDLNCPFKINESCLIMVEEGEGNLGIDLKNHHITKGDLVGVHNRNTITRFDSARPLQIRVMAHDPKLNAGMTAEYAQFLPALIKSEVSQVVKLTKGETKAVNLWLDLFEQQSAEKYTTTHLRSLEHLFTSFNLWLLNTILLGATQRERKRSRSEEIMSHFLIELGKHVKEKRSVAFYASRLCITPKHLSAVVKGISGDTATKFINRHIISQSQIMLKSSTLTIQQIAQQLNFPNQSFFGKFFKKNTGMSPNAYRRQYL